MPLGKVTKRNEGRRYEDACATAHAMDLLGERWALLVVRELMLGPRRFSDLRAALPGISANVLTQRLEGLEAAGVLVRRRLPPPSAVQVYELTPWGYETEPIFQAMGRWAARSPQHDPTQPFSAVSLFLSFRTMFDAPRAAGRRATLGFRIGEESYVVRIGRGGLEARRAEIEGADAVLSGGAETIAAAVYGGVALRDLEKAGALRVEGDRRLVQDFVGWFPLPGKVDAVARPR